MATEPQIVSTTGVQSEIPPTLPTNNASGMAKNPNGNTPSTPTFTAVPTFQNVNNVFTPEIVTQTCNENGQQGCPTGQWCVDNTCQPIPIVTTSNAVSAPTNSTIPSYTGILGGLAIVGGGIWLWNSIAKKSIFQIVASSIVTIIGVVAVVVWNNKNNNNLKQGYSYKYTQNGITRTVYGTLTGCQLNSNVGTFCDNAGSCGTVRCSDIGPIN